MMTTDCETRRDAQQNEQIVEKEETKEFVEKSSKLRQKAEMDFAAP